MMDRVDRITAALVLLADLVSGDETYIQLFERLDDELSQMAAQPHGKIARARAMIRARSNGNALYNALEV